MSDSRSITLVGDWLESEIRNKPELKDSLTELNNGIQKKLWHQVAQQLLGYLKQPAFAQELLPLQEHVVSRLHSKFAPLSYVRWSVAISGLVGGGGNVPAGLAHLEATLPHITKELSGARSNEQDEQAVLLLQIEILRRTLTTPGVDASATAEKLATYWTRIDHYSGVMEARVYAAYYQAHYELSKLRGNPQEYYSSALLYLTYIPLSELSQRSQQSLASDIGLAALLGANIYNFGELLQQPILSSLDSTEYNWLPPFLRAFNNGNIQEFNKIFNEVKGKYPTLAQNAVFLNQKLRIMTLMELVFRLPSGKNTGAAAASASASAAASSSSPTPAAAAPSDVRGRVLSFSAISSGCDIPLDQVEWLLMKALALKVIKGNIDQVANDIRITWVSPRVLDKEQIQKVQERLTVWQGDVEQTTQFVETHAQQVL
jgi:26S proteasome regulatory subunit N9